MIALRAQGIEALGVKGPQDPNIITASVPQVHIVDCQRAVKEHGAYRSTPAYYDHWARVLADLPLPRFDLLNP